MSEIAFGLVLNLHQPEGNLDHLLNTDEWAAREILYALDRIPRSLWPYEDCARVHLALSGTLLATLADPGFQHRAYGIVDCGSLLWHLQNNRVIDILGTAYYHPVLPLIPAVDRAEQLLRWWRIGELLFNRCEFAGMWPPEMGFCPELVPLIRRLGYRYVLVDSAHVAPVTPMRWEELRYRPHVTRYRGQEIVVVVRDRELSDAQESGLSADWFVREVRDRTQGCDFTPLVTTCTDGDNGGWFRNTTHGSNFWSGFYTELLDRHRRGDSAGIRPVFIHDYLATHPPVGEVRVRKGAWNTGWHDGIGFTQWTGGSEQRAALARVYEVSERVHAARWRADSAWPELAEALRHVLRAETSCNFFWGSAWLGRCERDLERALELLATAGVELG
jgi:alpha-amylase/alpha-mannosidase (GH57 family)